MPHAIPSLPLLLAPLLAACAQGAECGQGQAPPEPGEVPGAFLYRQDAVLDLEIFLDSDALEALPEGPGEQDADVPATLAFEDREWAVGLRLKGDSSFRTIHKKAAFKIDFGEWDSGVTFHGVRRLTLNNMVQDESMLSENLTYWLHAVAGGVAPRQGYACVRVNGDPFGLYSVVETMDEQFLEQHFADASGNLYEGGKGADLRAGDAELFAVQEQGVPRDRDDLDTLIAALDATPPGAWLDTLERHFVLDELLGTWAVELFVGNIDSYITRSNNFLLYHEPASARWTLIPWGADQAFQADLDPHDPYDPEVPAAHGRLFEGCRVAPACAEALDARIAEVVRLVEDEGMLEHAVGQRDLISHLSRQDPRSDASRWQTRAAQQDLLRFLRRRPDRILDQLEEVR